MRNLLPKSKSLSFLKLKPSHSRKNTPSGSGPKYASEDQDTEFHNVFPDVSKEERLIVCIHNPGQRLYVSEREIYILYDKQKTLMLIDDMIYVCVSRNFPQEIPCKGSVCYSLHLGRSTWCLEWTACAGEDVFKAFETICNLWSAWMHNKEAFGRGIDPGILNSKQSLCMCSKEGKHGDIIMDGVFFGTPEEMHKLMFVQNNWFPVGGSWTENEIEVSDWVQTSVDSSQGEVVQTINWKNANFRRSIHNEVVHFDLNDYISVITTRQSHDRDHPLICGTTAQCITWASAGSSRIIITGTDSDGGVAAYANKAILDRWFLHVAGTRIKTGLNIFKLPRVDEILLALEPTRVPFILDLLQEAVNTTYLNFKYCGQYIRLIYLLVHKHQNLPAAQLHTAKVISVLLSPEIGIFYDLVKFCLELDPSVLLWILDSLQIEVNTPNSDSKYRGGCMRLICLLVNKHKDLPAIQRRISNIIPLLLSLEMEIAYNLVESCLDIAISTTLWVLDLLLAEARRSDLNQKYTQRCMEYLRLLVKKHNILPPSVFKSDGMATVLANPHPENTIIFLAVEASEIPPILDLLLAQAKRSDSDQEYVQRCIEYLYLLVKKHNLVPTTLFEQDAIYTILADPHPEIAATILLAVETSKIPLVLDLLLAEAKGSISGHKYCHKCTKWLRLLVNRHHILPPSLFVNNITVESPRILAVGGYSDIYKGTLQHRSVCLKVLKMYIEEEEEKRNNNLHEFYKETLLWTQLNHPNLLPFLGVNTTQFPGKLALVSPWMANGEILKFLEVNPNHNRLVVINEIAAGIEYLHSYNIVHGDIKGANVLVDDQGHCYLADFGLATAAMTSTLLSTISQSAGGKGTMRWMAPELFTSRFEETEIAEDPADPLYQSSSKDPKDNLLKLARDIYAYACTIYEIVAGRVPFAHLKHDAQVILEVLDGERPERPAATAWCPDNIWALVQQCWAQEAHLRPTAAAVHAFLKHLEELHGQGLPWDNEFPGLIQAGEYSGHT